MKKYVLDKKPFIAALLSVLPLLFIYMVNPNNRVYSHHGFFHAGIVGRILCGEVPPHEPLLGGAAIRYFWGYHYVSALISKAAAVTPFAAFAALNVLSLFLSVFIVYKISGLLAKDGRGTIFAVLIAIFGITVYPHPFFIWLGKLAPFAPTVYRGVNVFDKFSNANAAPIGIVFFLLSIYSVTAMFRRGKFFPYAALFFVSIAGAGFFYPGMLAVSCAAAFSASAAGAVYGKLKSAAAGRMCAAVLGIAALATAALWPYLYGVSAGVRHFTVLSGAYGMAGKLMGIAWLFLPLSVVIYRRRAHLKKSLDRQSSAMLAAATAACLGCYVIFSVPFDNEYKFLLAASLTLGIIGGAAFGTMPGSVRIPVIAGLLLLFLLPSGYTLIHKSVYLSDKPVIYAEHGRLLDCKDPEEQELYSWIRAHTPCPAVFLDTKRLIPAFAGRQLLIGTEEDNRWINKAGYTVDTESYLLNFGYDPGLVRQRRIVMRYVYDTDRDNIDDRITALFLARDGIYIVARNAKMARKLARNGFRRAFVSSKDGFSIYECSGGCGVSDVPGGRPL